jgi:meiotic recombination protein REC8
MPNAIYRDHSSPASFSRLLLSQDDLPLGDAGPLANGEVIPRPVKKSKKVRLLLDSRTELTDNELKVSFSPSAVAICLTLHLKAARAQYLEAQNALRREMELKRSEKDSSKTIDNILFGVPPGRRYRFGLLKIPADIRLSAVQAQVLVDFWLENFKVQVEARTGALHINVNGKYR